MPKQYIVALVLLAPLAGCTGLRNDVRPYHPPCGQRGVVFSVDGAGGYHATTQALREAIIHERLPLGLELVEWTHGHGRVFADQVDYRHARREGQRLACQVLAWKQSCPGLEIYLVSHSAGSGVVLAAAEALPPASVDHLVLLAPSISADYDLRPALRCVRKSVDVFHSRRDTIVVLGTKLLGTVDRRWLGPVAGRTGFFPAPTSFEDTVLYAKLHQYPWSRDLLRAGNRGGHYGSYQPAFLRAYVLPILLQ